MLKRGDKIPMQTKTLNTEAYWAVENLYNCRKTYAKGMVQSMVQR